MDSESEKEVVEQLIKINLENGLIIKHEEIKRAVTIAKLSESTGIYIYGRYIDNNFIREYHFPFLLDNSSIDIEELMIERHVDKESFSAVCEDTFSGVTLIFYLQNVSDYYDHVKMSMKKSFSGFNPDVRSHPPCLPLKNRKVSLTALSLGGKILLPMNKREGKNDNKKRNRLISDAKKGNQEAIENLTMEDIDTYTEISNRIVYEDVFSIVDSTFMPCGVECDQYSVVGEILELRKETNILSKEDIYIMKLECNNIYITMAVNELDLVGEPKVGRRFRGQIWLQGTVKFNK